MSRQDDIAAKAMRKSTLKSLKVKKHLHAKKLKEDYELALQDLNIQYAEDPERLKAKYAAENYAKTERARKRAEKKIAGEKKVIEIMKGSRRLTVAEEIGSSIVQGFGAALFIAGTAILDTLAMRNVKDFFNTTIVFYSLFGASMILMYLFSTLQHALTNLSAKQVFNRLSHVWTFLIIAFGYSAFSITKLHGTLGWVLLGIVWGLSFIGVLFYAIGGQRFEKVNLVLYVIAGFSGLVLLKPLHDAVSTKCLSMLICGAIFYLVGIIFYNLKKIKFMHLIGNIVMLLGSVYIFFSLFYIHA